mmetsp:Transcript_686/g.1820  ORF Transcript_686/g.1820 Transcript_686/m.1820 type:complete len:242 (-) Transcript_686:1736-2461(-)|eukprot:CAMPEP_0202861650 /NCGR_PEP_ID=MMETSP1391-20130828/2979_1 /ASSEMBLY_ACC=CAM_ASM_000867 /TAXON_ID=1034604 /ORGANISM="Chlamydomonas leiostraca, Strain SAG 11-49" /LENGTH=241 /DNA_ID=CAMNT_0049541071 /DNA_START=20 /DNA_END=745 /DNA_ORIENTATION=-
MTVLRATVFLLFAVVGAQFPTDAQLRNALNKVLDAKNGGFSLEMWATIVDRTGLVKMIVYSGEGLGEQWPGSRVISAQKANTGNAFSLPGFAISTANLYGLTQPGGSLFGLQESNPVDTVAAYKGPPSSWGAGTKDPLAGKRVGGINVFGGGLPLYNKAGTLLGGLGISGDTSCTDHIVAWRLRHELGLDYVPAGFGAGAVMDNLVHGTGTGAASHPTCDDVATGIVAGLPTKYPTRKAAK